MHIVFSCLSYSLWLMLFLNEKTKLKRRAIIFIQRKFAFLVLTEIFGVWNEDFYNVQQMIKESLPWYWQLTRTLSQDSWFSCWLLLKIAACFVTLYADRQTYLILFQTFIKQVDKYTILQHSQQFLYTAQSNRKSDLVELYQFIISIDERAGTKPEDRAV